MRVLAVDTATEICAVALWEDGRIAVQICLGRGANHARVLMQAIHEVFERSGASPGDLDAFVVSRGPGSFTGLRIGVATAKGLATAAGKPIVGVSTLDVLAHQAPDVTPLICPMIDARRGEVYWSVYRRTNTGLVMLSPEAVGAPEQVRIEGRQPCLFIGSGARQYASVLQQRSTGIVLAEAAQHDPDPGTLARLGGMLLMQGHTEDVHRFTPVYLRKSDAESGQSQKLPENPVN
jgi:tRNA threonylcarbamoyladenosine biosynthesis protein TsaB